MLPGLRIGLVGIENQVTNASITIAQNKSEATNPRIYLNAKISFQITHCEHQRHVWYNVALDHQPNYRSNFKVLKTRFY